LIWNISSYGVLLDDEDYERLKGFKYYVNRRDAEKHGWYYFRREVIVNGSRTGSQLHRDVMKCVVGDGKIVDHINGDTLDCRKSNLRICTIKENTRNQKAHRNNTSGIKGVSWDKLRKKWCARITGEGVYKYLGRYDNIEDAKKAYAEGSAKYHGVYGRTE
jgi:hypothetical protein